MRPNATHSEKRTDAYRPTYVPLGTDADGAHHVYRTTDETIHVVAPVDGRTHVESVATRPVDDWMAFVDQRRGWDRRDYGLSLGDLAVRALEADA